MVQEKNNNGILSLDTWETVVARLVTPWGISA
jgi:hypothetical protein